MTLFKLKERHDCPFMYGGGWTEAYPEGTIGLCSCGRNFRVIRPAMADRFRWSRVRLWTQGEMEAMAVGDYVEDHAENLTRDLPPVKADA